MENPSAYFSLSDPEDIAWSFLADLFPHEEVSKEMIKRIRREKDVVFFILIGVKEKNRKTNLRGSLYNFAVFLSFRKDKVNCKS